MCRRQGSGLDSGLNIRLGAHHHRSGQDAVDTSVSRTWEHNAASK
jgi:hypothetical protein